MVLTGLLGQSCGSDSSSVSPDIPAGILEGGEAAPASDPDHPYGVLPSPTDLAGEKNFAVLMNRYQQGRPSRSPWVGYWWPYTANGIASGRYTGGASPAGKYDAARGGATQAQIWEILNHGARVRGVQGWWGHCNGWCVAAALYPEPIESQRVNGVRFEIADQKALLSEAAMEVSADFYGNRVDWSSDWNSPKYDDVIPAQYFLVLTNYMGKLRQTVLIDRYTGDQVWNQPLAGYRFQMPKPDDYLGADPAAPNVYRIRVTSTLWWMDDNVSPGAISPEFKFETNSMIRSRTLQMELWLDGPVVFDSSGALMSSGDVVVARDGDFLIGGRWFDGNMGNQAHPDYMWVPYSILRPDPRSDEKHANVYVDMDWVRRHILSGGVDDTSVTPAPIRVPPVPIPTSSPSDGSGTPNPPGPTPPPLPTPSPTAIPVPIPEPTAL
ncbi:hypothetical protein EBZ37_09455 [bacterium]|nr:hypothetical protein [bacterium]